MHVSYKNAIFASVNKNYLLMGFFDNKPKKKGGLFDHKYESNAWRKEMPYNYAHDSHVYGIGAHLIMMVMVIVMAM